MSDTDPMHVTLPISSARFILGAFLGGLLLSGCTVGPDFKKPAPAASAEWSGAGGAVSNRPVPITPNSAAADITTWWATFNDPLLTRLIDQAAVGNLSLATAESRVRQARAARNVAASGMYPEVDVGASATRARSGGVLGSSTGNLFRAGFDATWEIDIFGGIRRQVEAADADIESVTYNRHAVMVSLAGEVATAYHDVRGAQRQLGIAQRNLEAQQRTLDLTQQRLEAGFVSALDVANARANVTQTESQIPNFDAQIQASIYALSVLLGQEPTALVAELTPEAPPPAIPNAVPIGLPSDLLQRRPDIRQAESDLHAATARVGVAVADQYPRFSLTGSFGLQGNKASSLGTLADRYWSIGPAVNLPLFTGGRIQGNINEARELAQQATFAYRATVLGALQEVETSLVNFTREQQRRAALADAAAANRQAVDLSLQLYSAGRTDFLNVLTAQRQLYATEALLAQSDTFVATDLIALYKALGGGWDPQHPAESAASTSAVTVEPMQ